MSKELEALERAKREHSIIKQGFPKQEYIDLLTKIEIELKALEIIKKHKLVIYDKEENSVNTIGYVHNLPKEETDLLKEVLQ